AVGRRRGSGLGGGHDEREQTLNQILVELDGFEEGAAVIVLAATNRPDILDPSLIRPGRFDRTVVFGLPDAKGREEILKIHSLRVGLASDVDLKKIAQDTPGASGADLANFIQEGGRIAIVDGRESITQGDIYEAIDKRHQGPAKKLVLSKEELQRVAYHELGHALSAYFLIGKSTVRKITTIPRGFSLGATHFSQEEQYLPTKNDIEKMLTVALGGLAAERLKFKDNPSGGSCNDQQKATEIARKMICEFGMGTSAGLMFLGEGEVNFFGKSGLDCSESTKREIDCEIKNILQRFEVKAWEELGKNEPLLDYLAKELSSRETLTGEELDQLISDFNKHKEAPLQ
ncbi:MAG: AAA family ATPase, partial [Patescibacteria group bacterium]